MTEEKESSTKLNEEPVGGSGRNPDVLNQSREGGKGADSSNGLNETPAGGKDNGQKKITY